MTARWILPLTATAAAILAAGAWQYVEFTGQRAGHLAEHRRLGTAVLGAAAGFAERECRGGRFHPEELTAVLGQTRARFELQWLAITAADGAPVAQAGECPTQLDPRLWFEAPFAPHRPPGRGPRWSEGTGEVELPAGPLRLQLVMAVGGLDILLDADQRRVVVTTAALALTLAATGWILWARVRAASLHAALAASRARSESLETLRRLGAGLAHETRNPLGVVRGLAERIARGPLDAAALAQGARAIVEETDRTVARLDEFLLLSRPAEVRKARVPVRGLFEELAGLLAPDLAAREARLTVHCGDCSIQADREQLRRLFLNLVLNAVQALDPGGQVELGCACRPGHTELWVEDDGHGVPAALRATLFEPYVSGRPGGTGLGLAIARRIAQDHGFDLRYEERAPRGTRMALAVPA